MGDFCGAAWVFETRNRPFVDLCINNNKEKGLRLGLIRSMPDSAQSDFNRLAKVYRHHSPNSQEFELACLARYFALRECVNGQESFLLMDSDVVVLQGVKAISEEINSDMNFDFMGSLGFSAGRKEKQISPHFSLWTKELIEDFCSFLIDFYSGDRAGAVLKHACEADDAVRASGVSDMKLLYWWSELRGLNVRNSNAISPRGYYIDHNIAQLQCEHEKFIGQSGIKRFSPGEAPILKTKSGRRVAPICLHLPGRYKALAKSVVDRSPVKFAFTSRLLQASKLVI